MTKFNARRCLLLVALIGITAIAGFSGLAGAQVKTRLSIATGGTGGVYYPLGRRPCGADIQAYPRGGGDG